MDTVDVIANAVQRGGVIGVVSENGK